MALYREELEVSTCPLPMCGSTGPKEGVVFHSACHMDAPTWAFYRDGVVTIRCSVCNQEVVSFHVGSRWAENRPRGGL